MTENKLPHDCDTASKGRGEILCVAGQRCVLDGHLLLTHRHRSPYIPLQKSVLLSGHWVSKEEAAQYTFSSAAFGGKMAKDETIIDAKEIAFCDGDIGYSGIVEHINDGVVIIKNGKDRVREQGLL